MFKDIKIEIIKITIDIIGKIKDNIFNICLSGIFTLNFEKSIMITAGVKSTIVTINLLFSTPYLNNIGRVSDIYKTPTAQSVVDSNSTSLIGAEPISRLSTMLRKKAIRRKIMLIIYLLSTISVLERGIDNAYLSHLALSS